LKILGVEMILNYVSGLREESGELSVNEVLDFAVKAVSRCLNGKRVGILRAVSNNNGKTITGVVNEISSVLSCPKSTVWSNVNFLKELGLIENAHGKPAKLTAIGMIVLESKTEENRG
jgi:DNA-binding MarR family transcriptional regulator